MSELRATLNMVFYTPRFSDGNLILAEMAESISNDAKKNIRSQNQPDGSPFTPLAPTTIKRKRAKGSATPTKALMDTGLMIRSIAALKVKENMYAIGIIPRGEPPRDLIAYIHQEEGVNKFTRIIRKFLGISDKRMDWIEARFYRWVKDRIRKSDIKLKTYHS